MESKPKSGRQPKNQIIIDIIPEGDIQVGVKWSDQIDPNTYGMACAAVSLGLLGDKLDAAIVANADKTGNYEMAQGILDSGVAAKDSFLEHIRTLNIDEKRGRKIIWEVMEYHGDPDWEDDEDDENEPEFSHFMEHQPILKVINAIPGKKVPKLPEYTHWWMKTNFDLRKDWDSIKDFEGIELSTLYSRYSCVLTVGKLFDSPSVRKDLEDMLLGAVQ